MFNGSGERQPTNGSWLYQKSVMGCPSCEPLLTYAIDTCYLHMHLSVSWLETLTNKTCTTLKKLYWRTINSSYIFRANFDLMVSITSSGKPICTQVLFVQWARSCDEAHLFDQSSSLVTQHITKELILRMLIGPLLLVWIVRYCESAVLYQCAIETFCTEQ
jgi:hypothetical protein